MDKAVCQRKGCKNQVKWDSHTSDWSKFCSRPCFRQWQKDNKKVKVKTPIEVRDWTPPKCAREGCQNPVKRLHGVWTEYCGRSCAIRDHRWHSARK